MYGRDTSTNISNTGGNIDNTPNIPQTLPTNIYSGLYDNSMNIDTMRGSMDTHNIYSNTQTVGRNTYSGTYTDPNEYYMRGYMRPEYLSNTYTASNVKNPYAYYGYMSSARYPMTSSYYNTTNSNYYYDNMRNVVDNDPKRGNSLTYLIQNGQLYAGDYLYFRNLSEEPGILLENGNIKWRDQELDSPNTFARAYIIAIGQQNNVHNINGLNGWELITCRGKPLKWYKDRLFYPDANFSKNEKYKTKEEDKNIQPTIMNDTELNNWNVEEYVSGWSSIDV
jgi:hypothetical protein